MKKMLYRLKELPVSRLLRPSELAEKNAARRHRLAAFESGINRLSGIDYQ
ncbi:hypothetical protein [Dechloromonas sp. A34]|nr:hypothetical protein [Dechloromonas sp. A34]